MNFEYPCRIEPGEEHGYIAQFIDVEEAFTCGETIEECLHNAEEILTTMLSIRLENDDEIPRPTAGRHKYKIAPAAAVQKNIPARSAIANPVYDHYAHVKALPAVSGSNQSPTPGRF